MIRFIKNILDLKNLLGMNRQQPYDPSWIVLRGTGGVIGFVPTFTGDLIVSYEGNTEVHTDSESGGWISVNTGEDIVITGNVSSIDTDPVCLFIAANNTLTNLGFTNDLQTLDLRNADSLVTISPTNDISVLYANAKDVTRAFLSASIIANSNSADGTLYIDQTEPEAATVVSEAENKGWTIIDL